MEYTKEQIKQAEVAFDKLPPANRLATKYIQSDDYKYVLYCYKEQNGWRFRSKAYDMVRDIVGDEAYGVARDAEWQEKLMNTDVGLRFRRYTQDVADIIQDSLDKALADYRLADSFGKKFDVVGTQGVRRVLNCPVRNAYVLRFDGYFQLSVLKGELGDNFGLKAGDYEYVTSADSLKEIALGLPYLINLNVERCERELTLLRERGQLPSNKVVYNKWFLTDETFKEILDKTMSVEERKFSVVYRGYSEFQSLQVVPDKEVSELGSLWKVVGSGMTFVLAKEMYNRIERLIFSRKCAESSRESVKALRDKLAEAEDSVEKYDLEYHSQARNLDKFLSNNSIPDDVVIKINKCLTRTNQK
jgi:hypothetical protein